MSENRTGSGKRKRPRTCVGCGGEFPKNELLRIVRRPSGSVEIDPSGTTPGRGVYLCRKRKCLESALKRKLLGKSLKTELPEGLIESLGQLMDDNDDNRKIHEQR